MQNYHKHTYWSNPSTPDSAASYEDYAKRAVQLGHRVLSSVEHGWQGYYYEVFELAQKYNLKFIFGAEAYWVKDRLEKDKSNNHIVILAKNEKGRRAINAALSTANEDGYYFKPRLDIELLLSLPPDDVFVTTACVAFWKYDDSVEIVKQLHDHFKDNFMLEIQYHNTPEQISLNAKIKELSQQLGIEMIVGLDSHYIYPEQAQEREYVLEAKKLKYPDEDGWYMDYPSDEEIMNRFLVQNVFSQEEIQRAMDNTDITLSFDDIIFDKEIKLPTLYKDKTQEEKNKIFSRLITKLFKEYTSGMPKEMYDMYYEGVKKEVDVYKETGMVDYPLIDYEIVQEALRNGGMITSTGRGSGCGFFTNSLLGFSKVDRFTSPVKLYPERFISKTRILQTVSLPDLDLNLGNPEVFEAAQVKVLGADHAVPMIAFGTFKKKSAFKLYARAKNLDFSIANEISKQIEKYDEAVKYADDDEKDQIDIYNFVDPQYHTYIKESVPYWGIVSDKKKAPCAFLLYDGSIREEIGLIRCKSESTKKDYIVAAIDGAIAEKYKFLKNDLLKVDVVLLINKIFQRIGLPLMSVNELMQKCDGNQKVWDIYGNGLTIGVNQCEKPQAIKKLMRYKPQNVSELAAFIAAIRPAFKSMYSKFESREPFSYGIPAFDRLLQTPQFPQSFILYQEQTMTVLNYAGFPMDECYGIIKAIAKKHPEKVRPLKSRFIEGFKQKLIEEGVEPDEATSKSADVWQIISDSCGYGFNSSHAMCMAIDSMYCAYLKSHYPFEFYEVMLQTYSEKGNKDKVAELKKEMSAGFNIIEGDYSWGKDNRKFVADPSTNSILPSLLSIKGMSQKAANDLYEAARMNPNITNFYDCWKLLQTVKSLDRAKIDTLVSINYFKCFGGAKKIRKFMVYIDALYGRSQFSKTDVAPALYDVIEKYSETTEKLKTFRNFDYDSALYELWDSLADEDFSIPEKLRNEIYVFDYVKSIIPDLPRNIYAVTDIDDKFKNRKVTLYRVCDGNSGVVKIRAKTFDDTPLEVGSVIRVDEFSKEKRWIKTSNGFEQIEDYETILKRYTPIIE